MTNSLLELFFFEGSSQTHEPSMWTNPYAQRVATCIALQEIRIALQEIRIDFISQYQNSVSEMIGKSLRF